MKFTLRWSNSYKERTNLLKTSLLSFSSVYSSLMIDFLQQVILWGMRLNHSASEYYQAISSTWRLFPAFTTVTCWLKLIWCQCTTICAHQKWLWRCCKNKSLKRSRLRIQLAKMVLKLIVQASKRIQCFRNCKHSRNRTSRCQKICGSYIRSSMMNCLIKVFLNRTRITSHQPSRKLSSLQTQFWTGVDTSRFHSVLKRIGKLKRSNKKKSSLNSPQSLKNQDLIKPQSNLNTSNGQAQLEQKLKCVTLKKSSSASVYSDCVLISWWRFSSAGWQSTHQASSNSSIAALELLWWMRAQICTTHWYTETKRKLS